jgi:hypothetical protein
MGPSTTIRAIAPTRICDMGGWTDCCAVLPFRVWTDGLRVERC